jgi:hypothetical protein
MDFSKHICHCEINRREKILEQKPNEPMTDIVLRDAIPFTFVPPGTPVGPLFKYYDYRVSEMIFALQGPQNTAIWLSTPTLRPFFMPVLLSADPLQLATGECLAQTP